MTIVLTRNGEPLFAVLTTTSEHTQEGFMTLLKGAISNWEDNYPDGLSAISESCYDFNFGDLALHQENPNLIAELENNGIYGLNVEVTEAQKSMNYDTVLCAPYEED